MVPQLTKAIVCVAIWATATAAASACSSQPAPSPQPSAGIGPATAGSAQPVDSQAFCDGARQAGITNSQLIAGAGDPAALLGAIDRLLPAAPPEIRDDFATFDKLEHGILDPDHPDPSAMQGVAPTGARDAMSHVGNYFKRRSR
jgi:hypothetical protein